MQKEHGGTGSDVLDTVLLWGVRLSALAIVAITGYYLVVTFTASDMLFRGGGTSGVMTPEEFRRHLVNMETLTKFLVIASAVLALTAIGFYYGFPETGAVLLLAGAALFWGFIFMLDTFGGAAGGLPTTLEKIGDPRAFLMARFQLAGAILMAAGVLHLLFHGIVFFASSRKRRPRANEEAAAAAAQIRKKNDKFLGLCWDLPFCRDTEKMLCPVRHSKRPCWRSGRGCYCDQNIILTLSGGSQYQASRGSSGYLSRMATVTRPKTLREKRDQCLQCPVYLHHQSQKYQVLAPFSLILAVGAFAWFWYTGGLIATYQLGAHALGRAMGGLTFGQSTTGVPTWVNDLATNPGLMWAILGVTLVLVIAYLLHGVEWMLYRLGI